MKRVPRARRTTPNYRSHSSTPRPTRTRHPAARDATCSMVGLPPRDASRGRGRRLPEAGRETREIIRLSLKKENKKPSVWTRPDRTVKHVAVHCPRERDPDGHTTTPRNGQRRTHISADLRPSGVCGRQRRHLIKIHPQACRFRFPSLSSPPGLPLVERTKPPFPSVPLCCCLRRENSEQRQGARSF